MTYFLIGLAIWLAIGFFVYRLVNKGYQRPSLFWEAVAILFWPYLLILLLFDKLDVDKKIW